VLLVLSLNSLLANAQNANTSANTNTSSNVRPGDVTNSNANVSTTPPAAASTALVPCPSAENYAQVLVTRAFKKTDTGEETTVELGDEITVEIQNLRTLLDKAKCTAPNKKIMLFLDGRPLKDVTPFPPTDPNKPTLVFPLKRTESSRDVWTFILGKPKWDPRSTRVSVGIEDEYAVESMASIELEVIPHGWFIFWVFLFVLLLIGFWILILKSDVLRDPGPPPDSPDRKAYSLSRTQAAWWFFIILASYLFIGIITGDFSTTITGTVLILLGISAGTVLGSAFIDAGKSAAPPAPGAAPPPIATNEYWWIDILSDANGVSFHRFQIAAWTFVLGIIFIIQVYKVLAMPTFDDTLLTLMGISAGTYLGLKVPEPK
jgi:hypothetical protein